MSAASTSALFHPYDNREFVERPELSWSFNSLNVKQTNEEVDAP